MINENIAYAKSILNKSGITVDSEEYSDYLKIRELCGVNAGYVGILTKLRFIDKVSDMDEIESILNILKDSKIDINKLNKLSYDDILDMFYDEIGNDKADKTDIELFYKDSQYSYYKVHTYKGILKIGSPSWCLKTKSNWDQYKAKYTTQWVVVDNRYKNGLISPDSNYLSSYSNTRKTWIRYGISTVESGDGNISWVANDDANIGNKFKPENWTFFGVMATTLNLINGNKKSYYDSFAGCKKISDNWLKVTNKKAFCSWMNLKDNFFSEEKSVYVTFSKSYSNIPIILTVKNSGIEIIFPIHKDYDSNHKFSKCAIMTRNGSVLEFIEDEIKNGLDDEYYSGIELAIGTKTLEEIKSNKNFIMQVGDWLVFNRNDNYYLIVNINASVDLNIPSRTFSKTNNEMDNPIAWYLDKRTKKPFRCDILKDYNILIIDAIYKDKVEPVEKESEEKEKKVRGFWDFLKGNSNDEN